METQTSFSTSSDKCSTESARVSKYATPDPGIFGGLPPGTKGYTAGPMSWQPQFNFPYFDAAADQLRADFGFEIVSPAELDDPDVREAALASKDGNPEEYNRLTNTTWGDFLSRDVKLIADDGIQFIAVLDGWEKSRGARLETFVGHALCGLPVYDYEDGSLIPDDVLARAWAGLQPADFAVPHRDGETRVVNAQTGGAKGQKAEQFNLLPWPALAQVARLYAFGSTKYEPHNWQKGYDWSLSFDSLIRHAVAFWSGEELDPETQCSHMASVVFHALALMTFVDSHPELDDRFITLAAGLA
jgi:hypothetical protein